ncbi:MAG: hypothetical protein M3Z64_09215, partial [Verrucomicrobiota bacterium]|nr:hypothetical protein [Verrucomicrobiota bacterium]
MKGIEPSTEDSQAASDEQVPSVALGDHTQIRAQIADTLGHELSEVVAAWPQLSAPLRAAIRAIVQASG